MPDRAQDREAAAMLFNSMIGKQIEQEAHMDAVSESAVTAQTHAMEKVASLESCVEDLPSCTD
jgi:t-SNARE complex subunit (syntaxin)